MKPILFNTEMVKAILDGRKTQTRRIAKLENIDCPYCEDYLVPYGWANDMEIGYQCINEDCMHIASINQKPKYKVGDILWVRETFAENFGVQKRIVYKAEFDNDAPLSLKWKPSIHMPKKYARIFLKVTNVGVARLQDILVGDIIAEGYYNPDCTNHSRPHYFAEMAKKWWINLWNSTAKDGYKWEDNPYVFVYEFEKVDEVK